jgi:hypothetical protein
MEVKNRGTVARSIELREVGPPPLDYPDELPAVGAGEFEARIAAVLERVDADWVVVYGDREHFASLVFLCNLDPRFEEALLVLGRGRRTLLVGKEDVGYAAIVPIDVDVVCVPSLSLMGIDRSEGPTLEWALRGAGIAAGDRIGVVGWKALLPEEWSGAFRAIFAPAFFVDTLREIAGGAERVADATDALTNARTGLRATSSADQIAVFEWGASRCSAFVSRILAATGPGVSEQDAVRAAGWGGEPLSYHPVFASGPEIANGLLSPSTRRLELGDAAVAAIGLWGGNCARAGIVAATEADLRAESDGFLERLAVPYWRAIATWYESLELATPGGAVFDRITGLLEGEAFASSLNPGHLVHYDEWMNSPIRGGSDDLLASGMVFQCDLIPTGIRPGWTANCEDTVALAGPELRAELAERQPALWARVQARAAFVREQLGVALPEEALPLSCTCAYWTPFWLAPGLAFRG